jgi:hypothetical protein
MIFSLFVNSKMKFDDRETFSPFSHSEKTALRPKLFLSMNRKEHPTTRGLDVLFGSFCIQHAVDVADGRIGISQYRTGTFFIFCQLVQRLLQYLLF